MFATQPNVISLQASWNFRLLKTPEEALEEAHFSALDAQEKDPSDQFVYSRKMSQYKNGIDFPNSHR